MRIPTAILVLATVVVAALGACQDQVATPADRQVAPAPARPGASVSREPDTRTRSAGPGARPPAGEALARRYLDSLAAELGMGPLPAAARP